MVWRVRPAGTPTGGTPTYQWASGSAGPIKSGLDDSAAARLVGQGWLSVPPGTFKSNQAWWSATRLVNATESGQHGRPRLTYQ